MEKKICPHCGAEIDAEASRCYMCQKWLNENAIPQADKPQDFLATLLFAAFWGCFGIHRFYTGHVAVGVVQLLTLGCCGIWSYIDFIMICFNQYRDSQGRLLRNFDKNIGVVAFVLSLIPLVIVLFMIVMMFTVFITLSPAA